MTNIIARAICFALVAGVVTLVAQPCRADQPLYLDPSASVPARVGDLLERLTIDEKIGLLVNDSPGVPRLGIPAMNWWSEALHGVARAGRATVFPEPVGLAAAWDPALVQQIGVAVSEETRAKYFASTPQDHARPFHGLMVWSPMINIVRDPRWGRAQEGFGEDPSLTARMAVAYITGLQGDGPYWRVAATAKHFVAYSGPEEGRANFDAKVSTADLQYTYLPAFHAAVRDGGVAAVMCSYNAINGTPNCASRFLLQSILRNEWHFTGAVVSDCGAVAQLANAHHIVATPSAAAAVALRSDVDIDCGKTFLDLHHALDDGLATAADIDRATEQVLTLIFRLGLLAPDAARLGSQFPARLIDSPAHRALALAAAEASLTLLRNVGGFLPLDPAQRKRVAVIGPNADRPAVLLGNYSGTPDRIVTPLAGIRGAAGGNAVQYAEGAPLSDQRPVAVPGRYLRLTTDNGTPWLGELSLDWWDDYWTDLPPDRIASWHGQLVLPDAGDYVLAFQGEGQFRISLDGRPLIDEWTATDRSWRERQVELPAQSARTATISIELRDGHVAKLKWIPPWRPMLERARRTAIDADIIVLVLGLSNDLEGEERPYEGGDRTNLDLPRSQQRLLATIDRLGKPIVLVNLSGSAVVLPAARNIRAILQAWYPGQDGGTAIGQTIFGLSTPGGKLPVSFYASDAALAPFDSYAMQGRTYRYASPEALRWPFGFGLTYTRFAYHGDVRCVAANLEVHLHLTNTGARGATDVLQLYLQPIDNVARPYGTALLDFHKLFVPARQSRDATFTIADTRLPPGRFRLILSDHGPFTEVSTLVKLAGSSACDRFDQAGATR